jgi:hypothetical protein
MDVERKTWGWGLVSIEIWRFFDQDQYWEVTGEKEKEGVTPTSKVVLWHEGYIVFQLWAFKAESNHEFDSIIHESSARYSTSKLSFLTNQMGQ